MQSIISTVLKSEKRVSFNEAVLLLAHALAQRKEFVIAHPEAKVPPPAARLFKKLCAKRVLGVPFAYLARRKEFFGLDFCVNSRVLIPRPETEVLVEEVLRLAKKIKKPCVSVCDVGTGCGNIAVALAKNIPNAKITAIDICPFALASAKKNAKNHNISSKIKFIKSDLLEKAMALKFDILAANLPYIGEDEKEDIAPEVRRYEPKKALFAGKTGLELFERLFGQISRMEFMPKWIVLECGWRQKPALTKMTSEYFGKSAISWKNDLAGIPRILTIKLPNHKAAGCAIFPENNFQEESAPHAARVPRKPSTTLLFMRNGAGLKGGSLPV